MRDPSDALKSEILGDYLDDERVLAMTLAVWFLNGVHANPKATPGNLGTLKTTADSIGMYLRDGS